MPDIDKMLAFEDGALDEAQTIEFIQGLIDSGVVWVLQGYYGRTAQRLIATGKCHPQR